MLINSTTVLAKSFYANVLLASVFCKGILTQLNPKSTNVNCVSVHVQGYLTAPVVQVDMFFYQSGVLDRGVSSNDFPGLENLCKKIIKEKQPFERLEIKKETLLEMFKVPTDTDCNEGALLIQLHPLLHSTTSSSAAF